MRRAIRQLLAHGYDRSARAARRLSGSERLAALCVAHLLEFGERLVEFATAFGVALASVEEAQRGLHALQRRELRQDSTRGAGGVVFTAGQQGIRRLRVLGRLQRCDLVSQLLRRVGEGAEARPDVRDALCVQSLLDLTLRRIRFASDRRQLGAVGAGRESAAASAPCNKREHEQQRDAADEMAFPSRSIHPILP